MKFRADLLAKDLLDKVNALPHDARISLRDASKMCGVSPATLSRVARKKPCDMMTFARLCAFLQRKPGRYLR